MDKPCPCHSGKTYTKCCQPFHEGEKPKSALELMRARYSAYALNIPDYIIETTHPKNSHFSENKTLWKKDLSNYSKAISFNKLDILDFKENATLATVTFVSYCSQDQDTFIFTERSVFEKLEGLWLYRSGITEEGVKPDMVIPGEFKLLPLAVFGDAVLRKKGELITEINHTIHELIEAMTYTLKVYDGAGIAAPQVHHSLRLFLVRAPEEYNVEVVINPKLSEPSESTWQAPEGCLSIPKIREKVTRPKEITVEYTDIKGNVRKKRVSGWEAKIFMHENDHINGILFIDRLDSKKKADANKILKRFL